MFLAPTNELEIDIVNFCIDNLKLPFGEFWYKWFSSSRVESTGNHTIHLDTNHTLDVGKLKTEFSKLPFVKSIFKIQCIDVHAIDADEAYKYQYFIHFKSDIFQENRFNKNGL